MVDLTGYPMAAFTFTDPVTQNNIRTGALFDIINTFDEVGFLITATTGGEDHMTEKGGARSEEGGLVPGHCYSVIRTA